MAHRYSGVCCMPAPRLFFGIILIGHGRLVPYVSVWVDRLVLAMTTLGLPLLVSFGVHRFVSRRIGVKAALSTALERFFRVPQQE